MCTSFFYKILRPSAIWVMDKQKLSKGEKKSWSLHKKHLFAFVPSAFSWGSIFICFIQDYYLINIICTILLMFSCRFLGSIKIALLANTSVCSSWVEAQPWRPVIALCPQREPEWGESEKYIPSLRVLQGVLFSSFCSLI